MFKTESGLNQVSGLIQRTWSTNESKTPAVLPSISHMSNQVFIHPLMPLFPSTIFSSVPPSSFSSGHSFHPLISQSSLQPAAASFSFLISFTCSSIMSPPLVTHPSIFPLYFLYHLLLFGINQSSPCGLVQRFHYAPPQPRSHIYFIAGRLERTQALLANERVNFHMHYSHVEAPQGSPQLETPCGTNGTQRQ